MLPRTKQQMQKQNLERFISENRRCIHGSMPVCVSIKIYVVQMCQTCEKFWLCFIRRLTDCESFNTSFMRSRRKTLKTKSIRKTFLNWGHIGNYVHLYGFCVSARINFTLCKTWKLVTLVEILNGFSYSFLAQLYFMDRRI